MKNEFMDPMTKISCKRKGCYWSGVIKNTREEVKYRHGNRFHKQMVFEYYCPECKALLAQDIGEARMKDRARPKPLTSDDRRAAEL